MFDVFAGVRSDRARRLLRRPRPSIACLAAACIAVSVLGTDRLEAQSEAGLGIASLAILRSSAEELLPVMLQEAEQLTSANERLDKERRLYVEQIDGRLKNKDRALGVKIDQYHARVDRHQAEVERWKQACPSPMRPGPQLEKCNSEVEVINRIKRDTDNEREGIEKEQSQIRNEAAVYDRRMNELATQIKSNFDKWLKLKARVDDIAAKIAVWDRRLVDLCKRPMTDEELKYCHSKPWDKARAGLPPLNR